MDIGFPFPVAPTSLRGARAQGLALVVAAGLAIATVACGKDSPSPGSTGEKSASAGSGVGGARVAQTQSANAGETLVFERVVEPNERAFTILVPEGWQTEGGIFRVDPTRAGGPGNAVMAKNQFLVKRDADISVGVLFMPSMTYADLRGAPAASAFPPGSNYQGMEVRPMPEVHDFLMWGFRELHDEAGNLNVLARAELPALARAYERGLASTNRGLRMAGLPPATVTAGALELEYDEEGVRYWEVSTTALLDMRGSAMSWSNDQTVVVRAPAAEKERWKPVLQIIRQSVRIDPTWWAKETKAAADRAEFVNAVAREVQRLDRDIFESRRRTNGEIMHDNYLVLTGQEEYANPFTHQPEIDVSSYDYRWVTESGERVYTNDKGFDPNRAQHTQGRTWKLSKPKSGM